MLGHVGNTYLGAEQIAGRPPRARPQRRGALRRARGRRGQLGRAWARRRRRVDRGRTGVPITTGQKPSLAGRAPSRRGGWRRVRRARLAPLRPALGRRGAEVEMDGGELDAIAVCLDPQAAPRRASGRAAPALDRVRGLAQPGRQVLATVLSRCHRNPDGACREAYPKGATGLVGGDARRTRIMHFLVGPV
jgi:hypothetical protein